MSARRVRSDDAIPSRRAGVDAVSALVLLEDAQAHVGLGHPHQCRLQSHVAPIPDVVSAESNWHPSTRRTPGTPTRSLPTDAFSFPIPVSLLAPACLPFCCSLSRSVSVGLPPPFPTLFFSLLSSLSYSVPFTSA